MKTYLLSIPQRLKLFNKVLDAKTQLINKSWRVLNDDGVVESYFFKDNGEIIISQNGMAQIGKYEVLPIGKILVSIADKNYILRPTATEDKAILGFFITILLLLSIIVLGFFLNEENGEFHVAISILVIVLILILFSLCAALGIFPDLSTKRYIKELLAGDSLSDKQRKWLEEYLRDMQKR